MRGARSVTEIYVFITITWSIPLMVHHEGIIHPVVSTKRYDSNAWCALSCRYLRFYYYRIQYLRSDGTPRGYHPPSSQCLGTDTVYKICLYLKFTVRK